MNHFGNKNIQQQLLSSPSSNMSLLSDDKEMNNFFCERKRINDEYINSLKSFLHDVEETKRLNQERKKKKNATAAMYDPWECLVATTKTTTTTTKLPTTYNNPPRPSPPYPPVVPPSTTPIATATATTGKIDQQRYPLKSCKLRRRNCFVVLYLHCCKKLHHHRRVRVPSCIMYVNDDNYGYYPSMSEFQQPIHSELAQNINTSTTNGTTPKRTKSMKKTTLIVVSQQSPGGSDKTLHSAKTLVISNQTSNFC